MKTTTHSSRQKIKWKVLVYAVVSVLFLVLNALWGSVSFSPQTSAYNLCKILRQLLSFALILLEGSSLDRNETAGIVRLGILYVASFIIGVSGRILLDQGMSFDYMVLGIFLLIICVLACVFCIHGFTRDSSNKINLSHD